MTNKNLLVELFVEELPPKALQKLGEAFGSTIAKSLVRDGVASASSVTTIYASPRRLAVHISEVLSKAPDAHRSIKLMPTKVGYGKDGAPTVALQKKLATFGGLLTAIGDRLINVADGSTEYIHLEREEVGSRLEGCLGDALEEAIRTLPIPKVMGYQLADGWTTVSFVRPAHGLVALHGSDVVPVEALGLKAGNVTQGHRFEAAKSPVLIADADSYAATLEKDGARIASFEKRKEEIKRQLVAAATKVGGNCRPIEDEALLDEVTALVERPNVLVCEFEKQFLDVPQECLILTMKANQKYFPLLDAVGKLTNKFLVVSNISPADASAVVQGNERVVRPRLADAKFFFDKDRKQTLESRVAGLGKVVYHNKLGTQGERSERVAAIAAGIVKQLSLAQLPFTVEAQDEFAVLASKVAQAVRLAKTDLLTDMVGEFPELQGTMGGYYARHDGLRDGVAIAIEDHYKPRFAGDLLPRNHTGTVVALADKLETLVGMFGIGNLPTGDKDPFALRRHALGVIRMLIEKNLRLDVPELVAMAAASFGDLLPDAKASNALLMGFVYERVSTYLKDAGYSAQETDAVVSVRPMWGEMPKRLAAVRTFAALPEAPALAAANKRVGNILKKAEGIVQAEVDAAKFVEPAEKMLHDALNSVALSGRPFYENCQYTENLQALAALKAPVDEFFDKVMVNAEDLNIRANRLGLLAQLHAEMNRVADLSKLSA